MPVCDQGICPFVPEVYVARGENSMLDITIIWYSVTGHSSHAHGLDNKAFRMAPVAIPIYFDVARVSKVSLCCAPYATKGQRIRRKRKLHD